MVIEFFLCIKISEASSTVMIWSTMNPVQVLFETRDCRCVAARTIPVRLFVQISFGISFRVVLPIWARQQFPISFDG
jgi:uncharacterized membrane protein